MKPWITLTVGLVVVVLVGTVQLSGQATDPRVGKWQLNLGKSRFTGTPPKGQTRVYEDRGGGIVFYMQTTTIATGAMNVTLVLYKLDGKDYAQVPRGAETATTVAQRLTDAHTIEGVIKTNGKITSSFTQTVSADGKTLTFTGKDADGKPTGQVQVFDKQSGTT